MKPEQLLCEEETLCRLPRPALHAVIKKAADRILASPANLMVLRGVLVFSLRYRIILLY